MAKIRDYAVTTYANTTASMVCAMPTHVTGDLLVACVNKDSASNFTTPGGWTSIQSGTSAGAAGGIYAKRAASASETVTFALTLETCCAVVIAVQDVFGSTVADAIPTSARSGADDSTLPFAGVGLTTAHSDSLLIHALVTDTGLGANALPPWINIFAGDAGQNSLCVSYSFKPTAGAVTAPNHWAGAADDTRGHMIEVRDGSSGTSIPAYLPLSTTPSSQITPLNGSTGVVDKCSYTAAASIVMTSVAGKTVTGVLMSTVADSGFNPFRASARQAGVSSTTNLCHSEQVLTATFNATSLEGLIFGTYKHANPRDYIDLGTPAQGGVYILLGSSTANWRAWVIGGQFAITPKVDDRNVFLIDINQSDTIYTSAGTPDYTILRNIAYGSAGVNGAAGIDWNELYLLGVCNFAGGTATSPFGFTDIVNTAINGCGVIPVLQPKGVLADVWIPLQFGGVETIGVSCDLNTFQFPTKADEVDYLNFHVPNDKIGVEFYGLGASDYLSFTNCVFTSQSSYYWRFNASHSASATTNFSGTSVVKANVTLRSTVSLSSASFINCTAFTQNNAALSSCRFSNTKITSDNPADISSCTFTSGGTGHAIEITTAGTYTFSGNTFSGYGADGTTDAAVYNNSGGSVTLNIAGGGGVPTIRNGAGASTTINNAVTVTVTAYDATTSVGIQNARVLVQASGGGPLPAGATVTITRSGSTATVTHTAHGLSTGNSVAIRNANQPEYNGVFTITVVNANSYTYTVSGTPVTPATGTITCHGVVIYGLTDASGVISNTTFNFSSNQPVTGTVRKGTSAPLYKSSTVSGTITSSGLALSTFMISDE